MKKVIFMMIILMSITLNSQETKENIKITETERIVDKYGNKIVEGFNKIVEGITPIAEEGFSVVVKLKIAEGIAYMLLPLLSIIFWLIFFNNYKMALINQEKQRVGFWVDARRGGAAVISLIIGVMTTLFSIYTVYWGLAYLIAPEWFAVKEIIELTQGFKK